VLATSHTWLKGFRRHFAPLHIPVEAITNRNANLVLIG